jgi:hypothetical protein
VCGRVLAGVCADAIAQALAAYPDGSSADGIAAEYTCPPGAWCSWRESYVVAFLAPGASTVTPWPPTYLVVPAVDKSAARTTPWPVGQRLDDYVAAVIREAGWNADDLPPAAATASPAQFSRAELESVFANVTAQVSSLLKQGYPIVSIVSDDVIDRVVIGIHPYDESTADALRAMFGPAVLVKEREPFHQL